MVVARSLAPLRGLLLKKRRWKMLASGCNSPISSDRHCDHFSVTGQLSLPCNPVGRRRGGWAARAGAAP